MGKSVFNIAATLDIMPPGQSRSLVEAASDEDTGLTMGLGRHLGIPDNHWLSFPGEDQQLYKEVIA
jgi:hypothetical protein